MPTRLPHHLRMAPTVYALADVNCGAGAPHSERRNHSPKSLHAVPVSHGYEAYELSDPAPRRVSHPRDCERLRLRA
jgi:hypothetical protein